VTASPPSGKPRGLRIYNFVFKKAKFLALSKGGEGGSPQG